MDKVENKIQETLNSIRETKMELEECVIMSLIDFSVRGIDLYIQLKIDGKEENIFKNEEIKNKLEEYLKTIIHCKVTHLIYKRENLPYEGFIFDIISNNENFWDLKLGEIKQMISHYKMDFFKFVNDFVEIETGRQ